MTTVDLPLLPLGRGTDLTAERGVECPGDLPAPSDPDLVARARAAKEALGERLFVLGHHYQRDEVIQFADVTGDSFKLARDAAGRPDAEFIVFCGVHFMAESADILTAPSQHVVLPDLAAGCSMADMARLAQVEDCWDALADAGVAESVVPVTYMNSSADIKAFCGRNGGAVCTSSNADVALEWAFAQKPDAKVLFLPDQHLGRNTAVLKLGMTLDDCVVWDPRQPGRRRRARGAGAGADDPVEGPLLGARPVLRRRRRRAARPQARHQDPGPPRVHPRGRDPRPTWSARRSSSSRPSRPRRRARAGRSAPSSTSCSGSPRAHPEQDIAFLDRNVCYCSTMNRIDLPHLVWALESLVDGVVVNRIQVDPDTEQLGQGRAAADARPPRPLPPRLTAVLPLATAPDAPTSSRADSA